MKPTKNPVYGLLAVIFALSLAACGGSGDDDFNPNGPGTGPGGPGTGPGGPGDGPGGGSGTVPGGTLLEKLQWLRTNAQSDTSYLLELDADDESIHNYQSLYYYYFDENGTAIPKTNITITLRGVGANRTVSYSFGNELFWVQSGITLILDNNITLQGHNNNFSSTVIDVRDGGTLIMNDGSAITGNSGGGVLVRGTFIMNGGEISGNGIDDYRSDGGVFVIGTFTMNGGIISNNTSRSGGGVYVGGIFTMSGGIISNNTDSSSGGGGVYVGIGTFTMSGGEISGNTSPYGGGGVCVSIGTFTMNGGKISDNTSSRSGGGVHVLDGSFTMSDGEISGNTTTNGYGGGVHVSIGTFTMSGGEISGNTVIVDFEYNSTFMGGGVYVKTGTFNKTGGIITGYASDTENSNVVKNSSGVVQNGRGHAVCIDNNSYIKRKETTAGPGVDLSCVYDKTGVNPPTFTGAWDN